MTKRSPIEQRTRQARRKRTLGKDARCTQCNENDHRVLVVGSNPLLCYECSARADGRPTTEWHHLAGRANSSACVLIPANTHRRLSDKQKDWPMQTLRNPLQSPLASAAAAIHGVLEWLLEWIPPLLMFLDELLTNHMGAQYWESFPTQFRQPAVLRP